MQEVEKESRLMLFWIREHIQMSFWFCYFEELPHMCSEWYIGYTNSRVILYSEMKIILMTVSGRRRWYHSKEIVIVTYFKHLQEKINDLNLEYVA